MLSADQLPAISPGDFAAASASCPELCALRKQIAEGWPSFSTFLTPMLHPYHKLRNKLTVQGEYVFQHFQLIASGSLRHDLVVLAHEGHQGMVRTKNHLCVVYWWPGMDGNLCQFSDKTADSVAAPLQPVKFPSAPQENWDLDVVGPFETDTSDCCFAITLINYHSKWPEVAFTPSATTKSIVTFPTSVFSRLGNLCAVVRQRTSGVSRVHCIPEREKCATHSHC